MAKIYSINSEEWIRAGAKVDVDRLLKRHGMNLNFNVPILDFADHIGFETYFYDYKNNDLAGSIYSERNLIFINAIYKENYVMQTRIVSYLLGMYFLANDRVNKAKNHNFKEEELEKLHTMGVDLEKLSNSDVVINQNVYNSDLEESKEGDPELYFFSKELMARDVYAKALDRSF